MLVLSMMTASMFQGLELYDSPLCITKLSVEVHSMSPLPKPTTTMSQDF